LQSEPSLPIFADISGVILGSGTAAQDNAALYPSKVRASGRAGAASPSGHPSKGHCNRPIA
jgi:hypothetical protein